MLPRRPLLTLSESKKKPPRASFFDPPPTPPAPKPPREPGLLPGSADILPLSMIKRTSHETMLLRGRQRAVTFRTRMGEDKTVSVVASTDKQAIHLARKNYGIPSDWTAVAIDGRSLGG